jgi:Fe-S-cluster containining protein
VNPFDNLVLSRHLRISTTEFARRYLRADATLRRDESSGACVFLGDQGCTVHSARPLACRLYPLGREVTSDGEECYFHVTPHPQSAGSYGDDLTVADYLELQEAVPHIEAADRYLALFCRCVQALGAMPTTKSSDGESDSALLDPDAVIARYHAPLDPGALEPLRAMMMHIETIEALLPRQPEEIAHERQQS